MFSSALLVLYSEGHCSHCTDALRNVPFGQPPEKYMINNLIVYSIDRSSLIKKEIFLGFGMYQH